VRSISFGTLIGPKPTSSNGDLDTVAVAVVSWDERRAGAEQAREQGVLRDWLRVRLNLDTIEIIHR